MLADKIKERIAFSRPPQLDITLDQPTPAELTSYTITNKALDALLAVVDFIEREPWLTNIGDRQLDVIASKLEIHDDA